MQHYLPGRLVVVFRFFLFLFFFFSRKNLHRDLEDVSRGLAVQDLDLKVSAIPSCVSLGK